MGFEYGYSVERPDALVLWEAQFGDFADGAQTIVDEFVSSSEQKWGQRSSVVLLLPHGYEGQGPDHSSARIERYLQLCAGQHDGRLPSTPASHFHLLRRQAYARPRRPLIVFTPKSMLRLKAASSAPQDFTTGTFRPVIADRGALDAAAVTGSCSARQGRHDLGPSAASAPTPRPRSCGSSSSTGARRRGGQAVAAYPAPSWSGSRTSPQPGRLAVHGAQPARGVGRAR